ncbi:MAG: ABC transporter permease subunit [Phycisphaerae bacterium]
MFYKLFAIIANTFVETIRQPIYGVLMWVAVGLLILNPSLATYSLDRGSDIKIMMDVGLSTLLLYGLFASVFSAVGVITREIESHTVHTVVSNPVNRTTFLLGKFLGVSGAILFSYYFLCVVFLLTVRHGVLETVADPYDMPVIVFGGLALLLSLSAALWGNYVYGWHFSTTLATWIVPLATLALLAALSFDMKWNLQSPLQGFVKGDDSPEDFGRQIAFAVAMIFGAVLILTSFAVALATRFSLVVTLTLCAGVFVLGLVSDYFFGRFVDEGLIYQVLYGLVPNFQFTWAGDALTQEMIIPLEQVGWVISYSIIYALAVMALGVAMFQSREVS